MTESSELGTTELPSFQERLIAIFREGYGNRNVIVRDDEVVIFNRDRVVTVDIIDNVAVLYTTLTTRGKEILSFPVDEISERMNIIANLPWIQPSLYLTASNTDYVPNYMFCINPADIEDKRNVFMVIDNLCQMAGFSSDYLNDAFDQLESESEDAGE